MKQERLEDNVQSTYGKSLRKGILIGGLALATSLSPQPSYAGVFTDIANGVTTLLTTVIDKGLDIAGTVVKLPFKMGGVALDETKTFYKRLDDDPDLKKARVEFNRLVERYVTNRGPYMVEEKMISIEKNASVIDQLVENPDAEIVFTHGKYVLAKKAKAEASNKPAPKRNLNF